MQRPNTEITERRALRSQRKTKRRQDAGTTKWRKQRRWQEADVRHGGIGAGAPGKPRPVQKKSGSKAAASKKEKAPSRVGAHFLHSRVYQTSNCIVK